MNQQSHILPGLTLSPTGEATIAPSLHEVLFDLAAALEDATDFPVDVEHVVASLVLARRSGQLASETELVSNDLTLVKLLIPHIRSVFTHHGGIVGDEDR
jgi:hypothetical protein